MIAVLGHSVPGEKAAVAADGLVTSSFLSGRERRERRGGKGEGGEEGGGGE